MEGHSLSEIVMLFVTAPVLLPFIAALTLRSRLPEVTQWLCMNIYMTLVLEVISKMLWFLKVNNMPLFHVHTLAESVFLSLFFGQLLKSIIPAKMVHTTMAILAGLCIYEFASGMFTFNSISRTASAVVMIIYSLIALTFTLGRNESYREPGKTLVVSAILIYFVTALLIFVSGKYIQQMSAALNKAIWSIHGFIVLIYNVILTLGLWKISTRKLFSH